MDSERKPCPFCGSVRPLRYTCHDLADKWGHAKCADCGACAPEVRTGYLSPAVWRPDALSEWNKRAPITTEHEPALLAAHAAGRREAFKEAANQCEWLAVSAHLPPLRNGLEALMRVSCQRAAFEDAAAAIRALAAKEQSDG